ncbi:MAG: hypothetical protein AB7I09_02985 [Planctomycetota bacterium]
MVRYPGHAAWQAIVVRCNECRGRLFPTTLGVRFSSGLRIHSHVEYHLLVLLDSSQVVLLSDRWGHCHDTEQQHQGN